MINVLLLGGNDLARVVGPIVTRIQNDHPEVRIMHNVWVDDARRTMRRLGATVVIVDGTEQVNQQFAQSLVPLLAMPGSGLDRIIQLDWPADCARLDAYGVDMPQAGSPDLENLIRESVTSEAQYEDSLH